MDIRIPSLLRIKPNALYKLGKYLRKNGFHRVALFYGEGMADLVGQNVEISLESSEIEVVVERTITDNDVAEVVSGALTLPRGVQAIVAVGGGVAVDVGKYAGFLTRLPVIAVPDRGVQRRLLLARGQPDGRRPAGELPGDHPVRRRHRHRRDRQVARPVHLLRHRRPALEVSARSPTGSWRTTQTGEPINDFAVMISLQSVREPGQPPEKSVDDLRVPAAHVRCAGDERGGDGGRRARRGPRRAAST